MINPDYFALAVKLAFKNTPIVKDMRETARSFGILDHIWAVAECRCQKCDACERHLASAWAELSGPAHGEGEDLHR